METETPTITPPEPQEPTLPETPPDQPITTAPKKSKAPFLLGLFSVLVIAASFCFLASKTSNPTAQYDIKPTPDLAPVEASKLALKNNSLSDFDLAFLHLENKQENLIYSPLSIKYALAMLADGANGRSKSQITALIGDYNPRSYLNSQNLSLANAMFIKDSFQDNVLDSYTQALSTKYNAAVILDPLTSADNINNWVSDKTLNIIDHLLEDHQLVGSRFVLVNALAIDMNWQNRLQCTFQNDDLPCLSYNVFYPHTEYFAYTGAYYPNEPAPRTFNNQEYNYETVKLGATSNHYDILTELGETHIRETVQQAYNDWLAELNADPDRLANADTSFDLNQYISELNSSYGDHQYSTDFSFLDTDTEKVFAKDLREYDGATLQYIAIMPKSTSLNAYLNNLTAAHASELIAGLKNASEYNNFKDGVVTRLTSTLPLFKFNYSLNLNRDLQQLGITDIFDDSTADLSNLIAQNEETKGLYITDTVHKADIDFSNDGIKAAAATAIVGGMGAAGGRETFEYKWELPVEEIDLTFDQPFLFLIRDKNSGEVWFTGTVYDPSAN